MFEIIFFNKKLILLDSKDEYNWSSYSKYFYIVRKKKLLQINDSFELFVSKMYHGV